MFTKIKKSNNREVQVNGINNREVQVNGINNHEVQVNGINKLLIAVGFFVLPLSAVKPSLVLLTGLFLANSYMNKPENISGPNFSMSEGYPQRRGLLPKNLISNRAYDMPHTSVSPLRSVKPSTSEGYPQREGLIQISTRNNWSFGIMESPIAKDLFAQDMKVMDSIYKEVNAYMDDYDGKLSNLKNKIEKFYLERTFMQENFAAEDFVLQIREINDGIRDLNFYILNFEDNFNNKYRDLIETTNAIRDFKFSINFDDKHPDLISAIAEKPETISIEKIRSLIEEQMEHFPTEWKVVIDTGEIT